MTPEQVSFVIKCTFYMSSQHHFQLDTVTFIFLNVSYSINYSIY